MTTPSRASRRRARLVLRRTVRICRHHFGSFVTLAVLSVALGVALTSSSFSSGVARRNGEDAPPPASRIQVPDGFRLMIEPATPRVTYYLYDDEEKRILLSDILRRDFTSMARMGLPNYIGEVNFVHVASDAEEDNANFLINEVAIWAGTQGLTVGVVDLRER
jgi:hypothetical protein